MTRSRILHQDRSSTVSVVSLIPERLLTEHTQAQILPPQTQGGIVSTSTGASIAYLITSNGDKGDAVAPQLHLWKHSTCPLSQDLIVEEEGTPLMSLTHPDYPSDSSCHNGAKAAKDLLVTVIPETTHPLSNSLAGLGIYWISPSGSLAYWNGDSTEPSLVQDLTLEHEGDFITCLFASRAGESNSNRSNGPPTVFLGTAQQKVYSLVKTTRPLGMQLTLFQLNLEGTTSESASILGGIYNTLFTPAKKSKSQMVTVGATDAPLVAVYANPLNDMERLSKVRKLKHPNSTSLALKLVTLSQAGDWMQFITSEEGTNTLQCTNRCEFRTLLREHFSKERGGMSSTNQEFNVHVLSSTRPTSMGTTREDDLVVCVKVVFSEELPEEQKQQEGEDSISGSCSRIYVLWCGTNKDTKELCLFGAHWLNGYSSSSMEGPNALELVGLVARSDELENEQKRVIIVYCAMQQAAEQQVTCSAIRFVGEMEEERPHRTSPHCVDVNISSDIVPNVIQGMIHLDVVMDGCVMTSSKGIVLNSRMVFPPLLRTNATNESRSRSPRPAASAPSKEMVQVLTSHLVSTFDNYEKRNHYAPSESLASTLPQSISAADSTTLSVAVSEASQHVTNERINGDSALHNIHLKMERHRSFINFLFRAGVYKRVNIRGRIELRNHGEMIHAIGTLLTSWQDEMEEIRRDEDGITSVQDSDIMEVTQYLKNIEEVVTDFPVRILSILEKNSLSYDMSEGRGISWSLFQICKLISGSIEGALSFRTEQSAILYDLLSSADEGGWGHQSSKSIEGGCFPWTSRDEILRSLPLILKVCKISNLKMSGEIVRCIGTALLDGYRDITPTLLRDEQSYYEAKELVVSLMSNFFPSDSGDPLEDLAFHLSVQHGYFAGIVESCQNNRKHSGQFSENYDLGSILYSICSDPESHTTIESPYVSLSRDRDHETGLSFPKFVFRWYTDRNMFGTVLELGKACPSILTEYMQEDARLSDYLWIQYIHDGQYNKASTCLMALDSERTNALGRINNSGTSLGDRELVLSLAKLSSLAAGS